MVSVSIQFVSSETTLSFKLQNAFDFINAFIDLLIYLLE